MLPFFSGGLCLNLTGGPSPLGSRAGSTRGPIAAFPTRADTGGNGDVTDSNELFISFCSSLFAGINDAYELVDIEDFVWSNSCEVSELLSCGESLLVPEIDFDIEGGVCCWEVEERVWSTGNCGWGLAITGGGGDDDSSFAVLDVFNADLKIFFTVLRNVKKINKWILILKKVIIIYKNTKYKIHAASLSVYL
jgi:hypothetical protein